jgi:hypothetical protein
MRTPLAQPAASMKYSRGIRAALLAFGAATAACTNYGTSTTPTGPTSFIPFIDAVQNPAPQVGGLFTGTMTLTGVSGGAGALPGAVDDAECVGTAFQAAITNARTSNVATLLLLQDTKDPTAITAQLTSRDTGLSCSYKGAIGASNGLALAAAADPETCSGTSLIIRCLPDPITGSVEVREMRLVGSSLTATFDGWPTNVTAVRGQTSQTYNIFTVGEKPTAVAGFVAHHDFTVTKQ